MIEVVGYVEDSPRRCCGGKPMHLEIGWDEEAERYVQLHSCWTCGRVEEWPLADEHVAATRVRELAALPAAEVQRRLGGLGAAGHRLREMRMG